MVKINWKPSQKELKNFGWVILVGFGIIGALLFFKHKHNAAYGVWGGSVFVFLLSHILPVAAKPFYWIWMGFGFVMGSIMSRVVMSIIFYIVLTPVAVILKIAGKDSLQIKKPIKSSYWIDHPKIEGKEPYEHLF